MGRRRSSKSSGGRSAPGSDRLLGHVREFMREGRERKADKKQRRGLLTEAEDVTPDDPQEAEDIRATAETEVNLDLDGDLPHGEVSF